MRSVSILTTLKQGVGRKIFTMFLIAGVLPVAFTAWLAHHEFSRAEEDRVYESLHRISKAQGFSVLSKLMEVEQKARQLAQLVHAADGEIPDRRSFLLDDFISVGIRTADNEYQSLYGSRSASYDASLARLGAPAAAKTLLDMTGGDRSSHVVMLVPFNSQNGNLMAFRVRPEAIWPDKTQIPYNTQVCIYLGLGERAINCIQSSGVSAMPDAQSGATNTLQIVEVEGEPYTLVQWELFLESRFDSPSLMVAAIQPAGYAYRSSADFLRVFLPALSAVLILIALLSFRVIGQSLDPLKRLGDAAQALSRGERDSRVDLTTGDEFQSLASTFNVMADRLSSQIMMLEAMSEIDKLILQSADINEVCETISLSLNRLCGSDCIVVAASLHKRRSSECYVVTLANGDVHHSRDSIPTATGGEFSSSISVFSVADAPSWVDTTAFETHGQTYIAVTTVQAGERTSGYFVIGGETEQFLTKQQREQIADLTEHFAVAVDALKRERELYLRANFDALTRLPNRQLLQERLAAYLDGRDEKSCKGALLYVDLDRFKEINDIYGHPIGDVVLRQVADRIESELTDGDSVARIGGDEFVVLLTEIGGHKSIEAMAKQLIARLTDAYSVFGVDHFISASIGIVVVPDDGSGVELLMKNADAAMYRAKEAGRATFEFFNADLNTDGRRRIELERDLRSAIKRDQLSLVYQPQYAIDDNSMSGCEALVRWAHPTHGSVPPSEFIALAEESELIVDIGKWLINKVCAEFRTILDSGASLNEVSINVSARQLRDEGFVRHVLDTLSTHDIDPSLITLEVTETVVAHNKDVVVSLLQSLRRSGIRIAIDDFGTGYSSLSYLQNLPFDVVKIDKSFVENIETDDSSANICTTIIKMAHQLGKVVVAEGVETPSQFEFLKKHNCEIIQGFIYSRPLARDHLQALIEKLDEHTQRRRALKVL